MQPRWTWQALTLFYLFTTFSTASPPVRIAISDNTSAQENFQEPSPSNRSKPPNIGHDPSQARSSTHLYHRAITPAFDFTGLLPSPYPRANIRHPACLFDWQTNPEVSAIILSLGDLQLTVVSEGADGSLESGGVSGSELVCTYEQGLVSPYRIVYATRDLRYGVHVSLEIVGRAWELSHGPL